MTAAIVAAVAGVLGIAVGRLWDSRSEATRWRRDQKTECYQRLAEQFQATYEAIRVVAQAESDADGLQRLIEHTNPGPTDVDYRPLPVPPFTAVDQLTPGLVSGNDPLTFDKIPDEPHLWSLTVQEVLAKSQVQRRAQLQRKRE